VIESRLDESVKSVFLRIQDELPLSLAELDQRLDRILSGYLDAIGARHERRKTAGRIHYAIAPCPDLPDELRDGLSVAIGHAKGLEDTDPLHLGHPLLAAAIGEARAATIHSRPIRLALGAGAPASLIPRRGQRGRLVLAKVTYRGFEVMEHLQPVVVFEGESSPLTAEEAGALLRLSPSDAPGLTSVAVDADVIDDAIDEILFFDQATVAEVEQERFERSIEQIERFLDDRLLVQRRLRESAEAKFARAQDRRDAALGSDARDAAEQELRALEKRIDELDAAIDRLERRDDESYEKWRDQAHQRRYATPEVERILDLEFVLE